MRRVVEVSTRGRDGQVDRRREHPVADGQGQTMADKDPAAPIRWPTMDWGSSPPGSAAAPKAERRSRPVVDGVVDLRPGAVGTDVVDLLGRSPRCSRASRRWPRRLRAVRGGGAHVEGVGGQGAARQNGVRDVWRHQPRRGRRPPRRVAHRALAEHESVSVRRRRPARAPGRRCARTAGPWR